MDLGSQASGIGALADDTRRRLYDYVVAQPEPVSRDQAASALGLAPHNVNFHLDRLAAEGLLDVEYRRLSGRSGPGAGRPSKLYRRADREFAVTLPERRYDVVGDILATAIDRAGEGAVLDRALEESAHAHGQDLGRAATGPEDVEPLDALSRVLTGQGYEARLADDVVALANCPFDALARRHTALVCGLNRCFVQGIADGLGHAGTIRADLEPEPGMCCVRARAAGSPGAGS